MEFYYFGTTYYYLFLTYIVALPISAHMFLSVFYKMNLLSAYEVKFLQASILCLTGENIYLQVLGGEIQQASEDRWCLDILPHDG